MIGRCTQEMILDKLVEKKDLLIYTEQRITKLKVNASELNKKLQDPDVSKAEKKRIMRGKRKVTGRIRELKTLRYVISNGILRKKAKEYWDDNRRELYDSGRMIK